MRLAIKPDQIARMGKELVSMAYGNTGTGNKGYSKPASSNAGYGNKNAAAAGKQEFVDKALLRKFIRTSKSGKSIGFVVGDTDMVLKAGTRVVITQLSDKRRDALTASAKQKGFKGTTPTHELAVLPIEDQQQ